jgi:anti-anti-sigma regulatory factor
MERQESQSLIRLEGEFTVTSAAELKDRLLECLATGNNLLLDLERAEEIDITLLQLLWAAGREAGRAGARIAIRLSDAAATAAREAGFERFPGFDTSGATGWPR